MTWIGARCQTSVFFHSEDLEDSAKGVKARAVPRRVYCHHHYQPQQMFVFVLLNLRVRRRKEMYTDVVIYQTTQTSKHTTRTAIFELTLAILRSLNR